MSKSAYSPAEYNEAHLINDALDKGIISSAEAANHQFDNGELLDIMTSLVEVTYFVEYPPENVPLEKRGQALLELFKSPASEESSITLAERLAAEGSSVSLAMITLDDSTAEAIRYLNEHKVPVVGWVVVEDEAGYWTNPSSMSATEQRTREVMDWAKDHELELVALGFDLEKPLQIGQALFGGNLKDLIKEYSIYSRNALKERIRYGSPNRRLERLMNEVRTMGYKTEVYTFPKFLKRIMSGMDARTADRYIEMLYMSTMPEKVWEIGLKRLRTARAIPALGLVTGKPHETPGRDLGGSELPRHFTQSELQHQIVTLLSDYMNFADRRQDLRNLFVFALNDPGVARMVDHAVWSAIRYRASTDGHL